MGRRILLVDDERVLRLVVKRMLNAVEADYEVEEAAEGQEALDRLSTSKFDLIIADLLMPGMDGIQLLGALRARRSDLPIVILTAVGDEQYVLSCFSEGAWDYMLKPVSTRQLRSVVRRALVAGDHFKQRPGEFELSSDDSGMLEFSAASDLEYVHRFRRLTEVLLRSSMPATVREDIRLAIEEMGKNAIEWGNNGQRNKRVYLAYCLAKDRITFKIRDEGDGFDREAVPDPSADPMEHMAYRESIGKRPGGYGLHIIQGLMDSVVYNDKGNAVVLTKYLS